MMEHIPDLGHASTDAAILVSVCVVTYNQGPYIRECLDSVLAQEVPGHMEIIVGDDASTDDTRAIVQEYVERYPSVVRLVASETNRGAGANYFATHEQARGHFVAHIDGDDYMLPGKLRLQLEAMARHPECAMSVHDCLTYDQASAHMASEPFFRKRIRVDQRGEAVVDLAFLAGNLPFFAHSTKMYRRSAASGLIYSGREMIDCHWHLYHAMHGSIVYIDRALGVYRQGVGVSHHAGHTPILNTRIPSPYLRSMFADAVQYGLTLGVPAAPLLNSAAQTYYRWSVKFALAGQMDDFAYFARLSRRQARLGLGQAMLAACASYPATARPLVKCGVWAMRFGRLRRAA